MCRNARERFPPQVRSRSARRFRFCDEIRHRPLLSMVPRLLPSTHIGGITSPRRPASPETFFFTNSPPWGIYRAGPRFALELRFGKRSIFRKYLGETPYNRPVPYTLVPTLPTLLPKDSRKRTTEHHEKTYASRIHRAFAFRRPPDE